MIEIGIDEDTLWPCYDFYIIDKDQWNPEIRLNISEQGLQELKELKEKSKLYQTKLRNLFELHGGKV